MARDTMNKGRVLVLAVVALSLAACMTAPAKPTAPNLTGNWVLTTETPMGEQDSDMTVTQTGDVLAGKLTSPRGPGTVDYTGKLVGNDVTFGFIFSSAGRSIKIDYAGVVEGETMKGKAVFGEFGEGAFTAKRKM